MTISVITIVYGIQVKRMDFFRWVNNHKEHPFYVLIKKIIEEEIVDTFKNLKEFEKYLLFDEFDELDEHTLNCEFELINELKDTNFDFNVFEITHDIMVTNDIILGSAVLVNCITHKRRKNKDLKFSWCPGELELKVEENELIKYFNIKCKYYSIRDDCVCCS
jgi:hypothetical protein